MLNNRSKFKLVIGIAGVILGLTAGSALAVADNDGKFEVVPPDAVEFGNTYGEWSARWWQWLMSLPTGHKSESRIRLRGLYFGRKLVKFGSWQDCSAGCRLCRP